MGQNTLNGYLYKPSINAAGVAELTLFDAGFDRVDAKLKSLSDDATASALTVVDKLDTATYQGTTSIDPGHKHSKLWASDGSPEAVTADALGNITFAGDVGVAEINYAESSTIVGWSSFVTKYIYVKKIGKTVFVNVHLQGESNSAVCTFTLPYAANRLTMFFIYSIDDTINPNTGHGSITTFTATLKKNNLNNDNWTDSGSKVVMGQFFYETA